MQQFDPNRPGDIQGEVTTVKLIAPDHATMGEPNFVLLRGQDFTVHVEWEVYGNLVPVWLDGLDDRWRVELFAESVGPGDDFRIASDSVPKSPHLTCTQHHTHPHCRRWESDLVVPANTLPEGNPGGPPNSPSGIYSLVVTTFLNSNHGAPGYDVCGFGRGPTIMIENPT